MTRAPLGFGMMRLPVHDGKPTDIDFEQLNQMVDTFLASGYTYFDTSFVYHNGESENAVRRALVERHPHGKENYTIATKFPTFAYKSEEEIEPIFAKQLQKLGVEYIDYYLLHNIQTVLYDGLDGTGGIIQKTHMFEHGMQSKKEGKIKHFGISFHSSAKLLDRILKEHPEVEFVQLAVNYIDWSGELVQAKECCDVVRKHGRKLIIMEPVKGGTLANLPDQAAAVLKKTCPDASEASWALRFVSSIDNDVIAVLSGMSDLKQMQDNIATMSEIQPLSEKEKEALQKAIQIFKESRPLTPSFIADFAGMEFHGVPLTALLDGYSTSQMEPNPYFSDILNYPKNAFAEESHYDFLKEPMPEQEFILPDGTDRTETVIKALSWLKEHAF